MKWWQKILLAPIIVAVVIFGLPLVGIVLLCWFGASVGLIVAVSLFWLPRGKRYLVVYSESEHWRSFFEDEVLPAFGNAAHVINLSREGGQRRWWHLGWALHVHCGGYRNRFPAVYRFALFGPWVSIRFYDAYMQAKKGKTAALDKARADLSLWLRG
ncbi:MAG: hypothetical protein HYV96_08195 [Opitutae bacterium]|nr:hypothetical protein [Opitutae bacterium]